MEKSIAKVRLDYSSTRNHFEDRRMELVRTVREGMHETLENKSLEKIDGNKYSRENGFEPYFACYHGEGIDLGVQCYVQKENEEFVEHVCVKFAYDDVQENLAHSLVRGIKMKLSKKGLKEKLEE